MDFVNESKVAAGWTMGFARDGREIMVVAIKASFGIPVDGGVAELEEEQQPLVQADEFTGEPGLSAPRYESDYAHHKPYCDVLLNGSAYAPPAKVVRRTIVGLQIGAVRKTFVVTGNRVWRSRGIVVTATEPEWFDVMPITYNNAFGGVEQNTDDPASARTYLTNPVGCGYAPSRRRLDGTAMPTTEERDHPITEPDLQYRPMAFGPLGRGWQPRVRFAGTYDQEWVKHRAPFWPDDFDYRYFQAAPPDQQIPYPSGDEEVVLQNLTPEGVTRFRLPVMEMPVWFLPHRGKDVRVDARIDAIVLEPGLGRFTLTWRAAMPMRRSCFDMKQVIAGQMSQAWQRARKYGNKPYYRGLGELVRARRGER
jgi:hypothetical protein